MKRIWKQHKNFMCFRCHLKVGHLKVIRSQNPSFHTTTAWTLITVFPLYESSLKFCCFYLISITFHRSQFHFNHSWANQQTSKLTELDSLNRILLSYKMYFNYWKKFREKLFLRAFEAFSLSKDENRYKNKIKEAEKFVKHLIVNSRQTSSKPQQP